MASASILHVGTDFCHRIAVMESMGLEVLTSECSVEGINRAIAEDRVFSAIAFNNAREPIPDAVVSTTKAQSTSPLVLFRSPLVECDERQFALVISDKLGPDEWRKSLRRLIEESRRIRELSKQLREESTATRARTEKLQAALAKAEINPIAHQHGSHQNLDSNPQERIPDSDKTGRHRS